MIIVTIVLLSFLKTCHPSHDINRQAGQSQESLAMQSQFPVHLTFDLVWKPWSLIDYQLHVSVADRGRMTSHNYDKTLSIKLIIKL